MRRRLAVILATPLIGLVAAVVGAAPASAATAADKLTVMSSFSQTSTGSYNSWNAARQNQAAWASYNFVWSTDYCSASPDQPAGFDFRLSCWRHDWGYRNYKAVNQFPANKSRIDDAFYADLRRRCATYNSFVRPVCNSLAWTYYQAVSVFGALSVPKAEIDKAVAKRAAAEARAANTAANAV